MAKDNVIKLDFDYRKNFITLVKRLKFLEFMDLIKVERVVVHKTVRGYHVRVVIDRMYPPAVIVAFQSLLGSDYKREILNLERIIKAGKFFNVLHTTRERRKLFEGGFRAFKAWAKRR